MSVSDLHDRSDMTDGHTAADDARGTPPAVGVLTAEAALEAIAATAARRDSELPAFPADAIGQLRDAGLLAFNAVAGTTRPGAQQELALVRAVAGADGSVGRIFDGHLNAVERLAVQAPPALRERELAAVRAGALVGGVWGGNPIGDEGPPAQLIGHDETAVLRGVKTFCSGAGGLDRALVVARRADDDPERPPVSAWIDVSDRRHVEVDAGWYRSRGLVASVSHRVVFHDAPVLACFGAPGSIAAAPWFARDALRTAASWAGMADTAVAGMLSALREQGTTGEIESLAVGRALTARRTIDVWLGSAARAMDAASPDLDELALHARVAISDACRRLLELAATTCGSRPFARGDALDRARRDLEVFLLQHRLDGPLARAGASALEAGR